MAVPKKATAAAVSRALTDAGAPKSTKTKIRVGYLRSRGFHAQNETSTDPETYRKVPTGAVHVSWVTGNFVRFPDDSETEVTKMAEAAVILTAKGFTVKTELHRGVTTLSVTR